MTRSTISYPITREEFLRELGTAADGCILDKDDVHEWLLQVWDTLGIAESCKDEAALQKVGHMVRAVLKERILTVVFAEVIGGCVCPEEEGGEDDPICEYAAWEIDLDGWRRSWLGADEPDNIADVFTLMRRKGYFPF